MRLFELFNSQVPGSGIVVDPNYKDPAKTVAKPGMVSKPIAAQIKPTVAPAEPTPFDPAVHKPTLINIAKKMGVTAVNDLSNLIGQAQVETASWTKSAENFNYTDPVRIHKVFTSNFPTAQEAEPYVGNQVALANRALANKNGNGGEASGDGWKYRGRGFIHLTGKQLYADAGAALHPENPGIYLNNPTLLSSNPTEAAKSAVWYFLHKVGKGKSSKQTSKVVNPAGLKTSERGQAAKAAKQELQGKKRR